MGLERVLTIFNGKTSVYDTELFIPIMQRVEDILKREGKVLSERDKELFASIPEPSRLFLVTT